VILVCENVNKRRNPPDYRTDYRFIKRDLHDFDIKKGKKNIPLVPFFRPAKTSTTGTPLVATEIRGGVSRLAICLSRLSRPRQQLLL
jgi:hypothetical protein